MSSQISDKMTQLFEFFFHAPNDMEYSQTGMIMGAKLFLSASHIKITDPVFNANMQKFMQQCVFYDVMYARYGLKELNQTKDLWSLVKTNASVAVSRFISPTIFLDLMTIIRSERPKTSGNSEEMRMIPSPCFANAQII